MSAANQSVQIVTSDVTVPPTSSPSTSTPSLSSQSTCPSSSASCTSSLSCSSSSSSCMSGIGACPVIKEKIASYLAHDEAQRAGLVGDTAIPSTTAAASDSHSESISKSPTPSETSSTSTSSSPTAAATAAATTADDAKRSSSSSPLPANGGDSGSNESAVTPPTQPQSQQLQPQQQNDEWWPLSRTFDDMFNVFDNFALDPFEWIWSPFDGRRRVRERQRISSMFDQFDKAIQNIETPMKQFNDMRMNMVMDENAENYALTIDLPTSVPKESIKLDIKGRQLTVSAEHSTEENNMKHSSSTVRSILLPKNVDVDKISAKCTSGQLKVTVPKRAIALNESRPIQIQ